jgi:hypothetical protein
MPKSVLLAIAFAFAAAAATSRAEDGGAKRGTTYTRDSDVSLYKPKARAGQTEVYILRGTEAKESQKDSGVAMESKPAPSAQTEPKTKKGFRGRGKVNVSE